MKDWLQRNATPLQLSVLLLALALGAWLRFLGLDWGAKHPMHTDERVYIDNLVAMLKAGDLDHRFYTYPGGFFYLLALPLWVLGASHWEGAHPFVVARMVVSAFGAANIVLMYVVGRRLIGGWGACVAAVLLAVAPLDIKTSHEVRPDILLEGVGIVALLVLIERQDRRRSDLWSGLLIGAAAAVKYTGLLFVPSYVVARIARRGTTGIHGFAIAALACIAVVVIMTPYALLHASEYQQGPAVQLRMYYGDQPREEVDYLRNVGFYLSAAAHSLGLTGSALVIIGAVVALSQQPSVWLLRLVHPLVVLATMSTAVLLFARLILPGMAPIYLLAGVGVVWASRLHPLVAVALTLAAAVPAARASYSFRWYLSQPSARDRAVDWINANVPSGALILETRSDAHQGGRAGAILGIDRVRYEVVEEINADRVNLRLAAPHADIIVTGPGPSTGWGDDLQTVFQGIGPANDLVLQLKSPLRKPTLRPVSADDCRVTASEGQEQVPALFDGATATVWRSAGSMRGGETLRVDCSRPVRFGRIELLLGEVTGQYGPDVAFEAVTSKYPTGGPVRTVPLRPEIQEQVRLRGQGSPRPLGQVFVLADFASPFLTIRQVGARPDPWIVRELVLLERVE